MGNQCQCKVIDTTRDILKNYPAQEDSLIAILNDIQERFGYIPLVCQQEVSKYLNLSMAHIYGVITFYARFSLEPKGKHVISVCMGTACFVKGGKVLLDSISERLKIKPGETTADQLYSIDDVRCVGACGLAPVVMIDNEVIGNATVQVIKKKLDELDAKEKSDEA